MKDELISQPNKKPTSLALDTPSCSPSVTRFAFAVAILDDALASNRVPHVRTDIVTVDAPTMEHASGVVLQQVLFECAMKRPQSALLHCRVMDVERLSKANS